MVGGHGRLSPCHESPSGPSKIRAACLNGLSPNAPKASRSKSFWLDVRMSTAPLHWDHCSPLLHARDLRKILRSNADVVWLAAPQTLDADARGLVRAATMPVATSSPPPAALADLLSEPDGGMPAHFIPLLRGGAAFQSAATALEGFGLVHCVHVSATAVTTRHLAHHSHLMHLTS